MNCDHIIKTLNTVMTYIRLLTSYSLCSALIFLLQVLPDKLALHFRGKIARSIKLESRSGHTFDVQVAKNSGRVVLQSGWESFVSAHGLKMLDFLVFKYDGISRMKVLIFDHSGCEKPLICSVTKNSINGRKRKEESFDISSNYAKVANIISSSCSPFESSG